MTACHRDRYAEIAAHEVAGTDNRITVLIGGLDDVFKMRITRALRDAGIRGGG
jgi:hypothetical protein